MPRALDTLADGTRTAAVAHFDSDKTNISRPNDRCRSAGMWGTTPPWAHSFHALVYQHGLMSRRASSVPACRQGPVRHVNSSFDKDHESITKRSSPRTESVVEMSNGPMVLTRQPGTHARPAAGGGRGRST